MKGKPSMKNTTETTNVNVNRGRGPRTTREDWLSRVRSSVLAQNWWVVALRGVLAIIFGVIAVFWPGITLLSLVLLFSAYMLVDGVLAIISAVRSTGRGGRWLLLVIEGLLRVGAGVLAFLWPAITVFVFVIILAAWSIVSGSIMVAVALRMNRAYGRGWMGIGGLLSALLGILLIIAPPVGALILTVWIGIYAIVFGIVLLALSFRLRARRNYHPQSAASQPAKTRDPVYKAICKRGKMTDLRSAIQAKNYHRIIMLGPR
jgi:uncharacterized membrane protein HdeD (DUF308 family)